MAHHSTCSRFSRTLIILSALAVLLPAILSARKPTHDFQGICETCHITLAEQGKKIYSREIDFLCIPCHKQTGPSHPSGIKPSMPVPQGFPLDWAGRMTCATCHDPHGDTPLLIRGGKTGKTLCLSCHKDLNSMHRMTGEPIHSRDKASVSIMGFTPVDEEGTLDHVSRECLACHDGSLGALADVTLGPGIWNHGKGVSHPIGVDYMRAYVKGGIRHPSGLNKALKLFNGCIGCATCHSLFSKEHFRLAINNSRSGLCLACHDK